MGILKSNSMDKEDLVSAPPERATRPLTVEKIKECRWGKPKLVCQVAFVEWIGAGHLRHCSFIALRDDKNAVKVVRDVGSAMSEEDIAAVRNLLAQLSRRVSTF